MSRNPELMTADAVTPAVTTDAAPALVARAASAVSAVVSAVDVWAGVPLDASAVAVTVAVVAA
jgi:hypothetical protein